MLTEQEANYIVLKARNAAKEDFNKSASAGVSTGLPDFVNILNRVGENTMGSINKGVKGIGSTIGSSIKPSNIGQTANVLAASGLALGGYHLYNKLTKKPFYVKYAPHLLTAGAGLTGGYMINRMLNAKKDDQGY